MTVLYRCAWLAALWVHGSTAWATIELHMPTPKGFVAYAVEGDWPVLSMQMQLPVAAAAFRIPNAADAGTTDSTNLAIVLYDLQSAEGRTAFKTPVKQYAPQVPKAQVKGAWTVYRQEASQEGTFYTILDAKRKGVADVSVSVRMAWPHRASNPPDYDVEMEAQFWSFLQSIRGARGAYVAPDAATADKVAP